MLCAETVFPVSRAPGMVREGYHYKLALGLVHDYGEWESTQDQATEPSSTGLPRDWSKGGTMFSSIKSSAASRASWNLAPSPGCSSSYQAAASAASAMAAAVYGSFESRLGQPLPDTVPEFLPTQKGGSSGFDVSESTK